MSIKELRELLNVPDEMRIGQHIYNSNRDLEFGAMIDLFSNGSRFSQSGVGVDIFNLSDEEFIRKCKQK